MTDPHPLHALAAELGVHTELTDGLGRHRHVDDEALARLCRALGAPLEIRDDGSHLDPEAARGALEAVRAERGRRSVPPVTVAWDGRMKAVPVSGDPRGAVLTTEGGARVALTVEDGSVRAEETLPFGYHTLAVAGGAGPETCTVISAPVQAWSPGGSAGPEGARTGDAAPRAWGVATHMAALRTRRSRSLADLRDFETLCRWVSEQGGDLVTALPLLPTFNEAPAEPSPYSPVSRLFWSELLLDLGEAHEPTAAPDLLDVTAADAEVRRALEGAPAPDPADLDDELARYALFRGAQKRHGRDWRSWPLAAREGRLAPDDVDEAEARFHRVAQLRAREQLAGLRGRLDEMGVRLGLDVAVGAHPDSYDVWSRPALFAPGVSVGAPPDPGFPEGQDWGFPPVDPWASRLEGHRYFADSLAHQARLAGVLRMDHVMALTRLYWIPHGLPKDRGSYVSYPTEELFAVLALESRRNECEIVGENLGVVPREIEEALPRHGIRGMYLALFAAHADPPPPPRAEEVALVGTHDTATFAGWLRGKDIDERVRTGLLHESRRDGEMAERRRCVERLARAVEADPDDPGAFLGALLGWLGRSDAPRVCPWLEDLWLEEEQVNLPGTSSAERPNWRRPLRAPLEELLELPEVRRRVEALERARREAS